MLANELLTQMSQLDHRTDYSFLDVSWLVLSLAVCWPTKSESAAGETMPFLWGTCKPHSCSDPDRAGGSVTTGAWRKLRMLSNERRRPHNCKPSAEGACIFPLNSKVNYGVSLKHKPVRSNLSFLCTFDTLSVKIALLFLRIGDGSCFKEILQT